MHAPRSAIRLAWIVALAAGPLGCSAGDVGDACSRSSDCKSHLQCFAGVCALECRTPFDCGDGYLCSPGGECLLVESAVGDPCARELECGPGQACVPDSSDVDGDGLLAASCQLEVPGAGTGTTCDSSAECRGGICALGRCTQLCLENDDCPLQLACVDVPRALASGDAILHACTQAEGVLRTSIDVDLPYQGIEIPVPSHARSFTIVSRVETNQLVGVAHLGDPSGLTLYATPFSPQEYLDNPVRYQPSPLVSAMMVPNSPEVKLAVGIYRAEVGSFLPAGGVGTAVPDIEVLYKLDDEKRLDLHFYFLNLEDHPCTSVNGVDLDADAAAGLPEFQDYVDALWEIFAAAGIKRGDATYEDVLDRPDLDGLIGDGPDLGSLARLADGRPGLHIFIVRSIDPVGIQALHTGIPGAPRTGDTAASAIAVGADSLCYRSWNQMARRTAHAMAQQMGLFDSIAPDGAPDPIADSGSTSTNLMYFSEFGGTLLTPGQIAIIGKWAGLR